MSLPILSRYVAVSVNCEESYEYSLATGRAKGKANNVKARIIDENSSLTYRENDERFNRSQFSTYEYLQQLNENINEN